MASSEGVSFRWEAFNRWCDEYADRHQGMKPKVEDVRRWHRENAERVWPDSSERPSVFLAVSHNKGRRVRGHKTCEYYKRYRAGKAAELQLAARLQPAALSGRRILAVTAAARKHATDQTRGASKRSSPDDDATSERELQHIEKAEKRRRVRASSGPSATASSHPGRTAARRASSEEVSEDPSWASGAESSDDDSGSARVGPHASLKGRVRSTTHFHNVRSQPSHTGVHITVVHRDSTGRTIQVHTQPSHGLSAPGSHSAPSTHPTGSLYSGSGFPPSQPFVASHAGTADGSAQRSRKAVFAGCAAYPGEVGSVEACEGDALQNPEEADQKRNRPHGSLREGRTSPPAQLQQQRAGSRDRELETDVWPNLGTVRHPGVAPAHCRAARSSGTGQQPRPPRFSGYVETPVGSMPVYCIGSEGGRAAAAEARRARGSQWRAATRVVADVAVGVKDPLDLLAQAACEALVASPGLAQVEDVERQTAVPGQQAQKEEPEEGLRCWSGTSGGSGAGGTERGGNGDGKVNNGRTEGEDGVNVKQEMASVEAGEQCDSGGRAAAGVVCAAAADKEGPEAKAEGMASVEAVPTASHSVSISSQHSGEGVSASTARPHGLMHGGAAQPLATEGSDMAAQSVLVKWPPSPLPQVAAALLPTDVGARLVTAGHCDGGGASSLLDLEAFVRAAAIAAGVQSSSTPACAAALPQHLTAALAPPATAPPAVPTSATVPLGDNLSSGALMTSPGDEPLYDATCRAAANATTGMTMAAALLRGDQQQQQQQSRPALGHAVPGSLSLPIPPVDTILPTTIQQQQTHALLWPALAAAGGVTHPAAPASLLTAAPPPAPPLLADTASLSLLGTQLLPMLRLLQMQMAARPDVLAAGPVGDVGGVPPALLGLAPVVMPSAVDVGPVRGGSPPSQGRLGIGSQRVGQPPH